MAKKKKGKGRFTGVGGRGSGLYIENDTDLYYHRPYVIKNGKRKRTYRVLEGQRSFEGARAMKTKFEAEQGQFNRGMTKVDPLAKGGTLTVDMLLDQFVKDGFPLIKKVGRAQGDQIRQQSGRVAALKPFWGPRTVDTISETANSDMDAYCKYRKSIMKDPANGGRQIDLELGVLRIVFRLAVRSGKIKSNPLPPGLDCEKFRGRDKEPVRHCREFAPRHTEEFCALATELFRKRLSEVFGWQYLIQGMTGFRTSETLKLRWDAPPGKAGHDDGKYLHLERSKNGDNPFFEIHPALRQTLDALARWRVWRGYAGNPFWFPSSRYTRCKGRTVHKLGLTGALHRIAERICGAGEGRRAHGARAWYVLVRRSMKIADAIIAAEIGDGASGAAIIVHTYGKRPANWMDQTAPALDWLTAVPPWTALMPDLVLPAQEVVV